MRTSCLHSWNHERTPLLGNFYVDLTRSIFYILLPLSIIFSIVLVYEGVIQNFSPYIEVTTLEGAKQTIPLGPVASQIAIKRWELMVEDFLTPIAAILLRIQRLFLISLKILPFFGFLQHATYMYGLMVKSTVGKDIVFFLSCCILWLGGLAVAPFIRNLDNPVMTVNPVLEGQETRFGSLQVSLWAVTTTGTSNGSVNSMHDSLSPLAGGLHCFNMMIGEVIFGGVGVGLCGMLDVCVAYSLSIWFDGGKNSRISRKKIEKTEMQWVMLAILAPCSLILLGSGITSILPSALQSLGNAGPHGLSEILYAFSSAAGNNGSAFAGLNANTYFYNISLALIMLATRLAILIPSLAIAGSLAAKKTTVPSIGTFATNTTLFGILLFSVIFIVAALTFFPALSLGPIVEQILMLKGQSF